MSYVYASEAAQRLHIMESPTDDERQDINKLVIQNQIIQALVNRTRDGRDQDIISQISRHENLSDTTPTESLAFLDYQLVISNATNLIQNDPNLSFNKINNDADSNELAMVYPRMGNYVVPEPVVYRNLVSLGGTIADRDFNNWLQHRLNAVYPGRNYAVTHFIDEILWSQLRWSRDMDAYILCSQSYIQLENIGYCWHKVPRSVYTVDDTTVTINVQFNTVIQSSEDDMRFVSYINDTQFAFDGVPILMYLITPSHELLLHKGDAPFMVNFRTLHEHNKVQDGYLLNHLRRIVTLEEKEHITPDLSALDTSNEQHRTTAATLQAHDKRLADHTADLLLLKQQISDLDTGQVTTQLGQSVSNFNGHYLDLYDSIQTIAQNTSLLDTAMKNNAHAMENRLQTLETQAGISPADQIDVSAIHIHLPEPSDPIPTPATESDRVLTSRVGSLEGLLETLRSQILALQQDKDPNIEHRLNVLEHMQVVHTSHLTNIDNEFVSMGSEVKALQQPTPSSSTDDNVPWSNMALMQRKMEQMNIELDQKAGVAYVEKSIIDTLGDRVDMNVLANKVADILTFRLGGRSAVANSLINASTQIRTAAHDGVNDFIGQLMKDLKQMNPSKNISRLNYCV